LSYAPEEFSVVSFQLSATEASTTAFVTDNCLLRTDDYFRFTLCTVRVRVRGQYFLS